MHTRSACFCFTSHMRARQRVLTCVRVRAGARDGACVLCFFDVVRQNHVSVTRDNVVSVAKRKAHQPSLSKSNSIIVTITPPRRPLRFVLTGPGRDDRSHRDEEGQHRGKFWHASAVRTRKITEHGARKKQVVLFRHANAMCFHGFLARCFHSRPPTRRRNWHSRRTSCL